MVKITIVRHFEDVRLIANLCPFSIQKMAGKGAGPKRQHATIGSHLWDLYQNDRMTDLEIILVPGGDQQREVSTQIESSKCSLKLIFLRPFAATK
jgi:hypothetical protein